ncbi:hypothetical protein A1O7_02098 [Cladophialophora yegresii CBS 114405]|uniref:Uncharacterized protein n=1 Tax=Cladophialophora yegresii CBS 114405 TaxID=1182544 RepID=W9WTK8_9EURO|nr:uncharacterized protein A1O7_02098 [Cladophialophora yegresii CBS 114405]EXJ61669.1 hypothetical protein A1O7_02098 [Cladophialophora yegresii CBS 114405]
MQKYTTREVFEAALAEPSKLSSATTKRVLEQSEQVPPGLRPARLEMETPTRVLTRDRISMNAPLGKSTAVALPNLESFVSAPRARSSAVEKDSKDSADIAHEQDQKLQVATTSPPPQSLGKRRVPHTSKDEWADSSADELTVGEKGGKLTTGESFQSVPLESTDGKAHKKAKRVGARGGPRYNRLAGPTNASPKALSMYENAVDARERLKIAKSYKEKICAIIDTDILQRVDSEGGITPDGRFYKAILMMMDRMEARSPDDVATCKRRTES